MKISKVQQKRRGGQIVGNARVAIISETKGQEGILYNDPSKGDSARKSVSESELYIQDRISQTKILYRIFNNVDTPRKEQDDTERFVSEFNNVFRLHGRGGILSAPDVDSACELYAMQSLKNRRWNILSSPAFDELGGEIGWRDVERFQKIVSVDNFKSIVKKSFPMDVRVDEEIIDAAILRFLKRSLSKEYTKQALKKFLLETFNIRTEMDSDTEIDVQRNFIDVVMEDCYRVRIRSFASKSIINQNMPVQPQKSEGGITFGVSAVRQKKKGEEQRAFNAFLSEYATLDDKCRMEKLIRLRRLVDLYFYGAEAVREKANSDTFDVWAEHAERSRSEEAFVSVPEFVVTGDKEKDKLEQQLRSEKIRQLFRTKNIECYRSSVEAVHREDLKEFYFEDEMLNLFFIHRMENAVEKIYDHIQKWQDFKLNLGYVSEKVWKELIGYIAVKYIAIGKAVYNYAMEELENVASNGDISFGKISDAYLSGITSFDYEVIKAQEKLQRETAVFVIYAARHLENQTIDKEKMQKDFLMTSEEKIIEAINNEQDTLTGILQFFGGKSKWDKNHFDFSHYYEQNDGLGLLMSLRAILSSLRNESFHYTTLRRNSDNWNVELIADMFEAEAGTIAETYRNKFYSNNLHMFFAEEQLEKWIVQLYAKRVERNSQVPAFNRVFVRKNFKAYVAEKLHIRVQHLTSDEQALYYHALYYLFKEIYYNAFLVDDKALRYIVKRAERVVSEYDPAKRNNIPDKDARNAYEAENDFCQKVTLLLKVNNNYSLSEICQLIMTEYNQQNNVGMKRKSSDRSAKDPDIYKHYKMLLLLYLRDAFTEYIGQNYKLDCNRIQNEPEEEKFLADIADKIKPYENITNAVRESVELQKWYVLGRLLNPKQVNHLMGELRSYKQYIWNIKRRASEVGYALRGDVSNEFIAGVRISDIDAVLDLCVKLSGITSNTLGDYFPNDETYAEYLAQYLDYPKGKEDYWGAFSDFCSGLTSQGLKNIYMDAKNPIMNRNIIYSKIYGEGFILNRVVEKVNQADIIEYDRMEKEIAPFQMKPAYNEAEQKAIKQYQEIKNHIEFRDLVDYSELMAELQGQLINWCYLRERDMMYFQLGFHYLCLHNNSEKPETYKQLVFDSDMGQRRIENAVLYQICAIYTNGMPIYSFKNNNIKAGKENASTGVKFGVFKDYLPSWMAGLELFENTKEHEDIFKLRDYIDHFDYFKVQNRQRSMLDIYSDIFDRFFSYDMKYRKNTINVLYNILLKYWADVKFTFTTGKKVIGTDADLKEKDAALIRIREKKGIQSEQFTYILADGSKRPLDARNKRYLETVIRILNYPEDVDSDAMIAVACRKSGGKPQGKAKDHQKKSSNSAGSAKKRETFSNAIGADGRFDDIFNQFKNN